MSPGSTLATSIPCALLGGDLPDPQQGRELLDAIRAFKPDVIYFDGIRLVHCAALVRPDMPEARIIMDFDDLIGKADVPALEAHMLCIYRLR
jgi:hypothetical protein